MTDIDDVLAEVRAAEALTLDRKAKISYLKRRGWRKVDSNASGRWQSPDGSFTNTVHGAYAWQLQQQEQP